MANYHYSWRRAVRPCFVGLIVTGALIQPSLSNAKPLPPAISNMPWDELQPQFERIVAEKYKDPDSVRFRWDHPVIYVDKKGTYACGWVNGKNEYGGYTGYDQVFIRFTPTQAKVKFATPPLGYNECVPALLDAASNGSGK